MSFFPAPPAADPLHIFHPDGPINPAFMRGLLETTLATQPLAPGATPDRQADHRLAGMHAIATFHPGDALEAMLAAQMVAADARIRQCLALATEPDADQAEACRHGAQAASLMRCMQATLRGFQRQQAARRKDEDQPSERSGYWFRDVSVPAPDNLPSDHDPVDEPLPDSISRPGEFDLDAGRPVHSPVAVSRALDPEHPMQSSGTPDAAPPPVSIVEPSTGRRHPISSAGGDRPDRHLTGDAMMRFASRRLDPNQSVEAAWAQAVTEAAAEEAEATRP